MDPTEQDLVSKTRRKREMHELQTLGATLVELADAQLGALALPDSLAEAVREAKRIRSREGRRRQIQYIGRLMRDIDPQLIRAQLATIEGSSREAVARHRLLERWRERLLVDDGALTEFAAAHPGADLQALRTQIRNARREQKENRPPRAYRELFRLIREAGDW
jgi:ribosome-associated protein